MNINTYFLPVIMFLFFSALMSCEQEVVSPNSLLIVNDMEDTPVEQRRKDIDIVSQPCFKFDITGYSFCFGGDNTYSACPLLEVPNHSMQMSINGIYASVALYVNCGPFLGYNKALPNVWYNIFPPGWSIGDDYLSVRFQSDYQCNLLDNPDISFSLCTKKFTISDYGNNCSIHIKHSSPSQTFLFDC